MDETIKRMLETQEALRRAVDPLGDAMRRTETASEAMRRTLLATDLSGLKLSLSQVDNASEALRSLTRHDIRPRHGHARRGDLYLATGRRIACRQP
jgi:predicted negative regulator of RcsB-dependent stress response